MEKQYLEVVGMTCQGCRKHVEEALAAIEGVTSAEVNLEKASAQIQSHHPISIETLNAALGGKNSHYSVNLPGYESPIREEKSPSVGTVEGYYCPMQCEGDRVYEEAGDCPVCGMDLVPIVSAESSDDTGYSLLLRKFWIALAFTIPIFFIAMSEMIPGNPLFEWMPAKYWNWVQLILSLPVLFYATWMFFERAYTSIRTWRMNMFTLIGIGAGIAWLFSVAALTVPNVFPEAFKTSQGTVHVYFEAATVILTLVLLGQVLEARAHGKTSAAIRQLIQLAPKEAIRIIGGNEVVIRISEIQPGDIIRVKPGGKIPVDGIIIQGKSTIDEAMLTGEPIPVSKTIGDPVHAGTINGSGTFKMEAQKVGSDTLLSQIIHMVQEASRSRAPVQRLADTISAYFVPIVLLIAVLTFIIWAWFGPEPAYVYALVNAIAVLIIACPCALGLATPMSVMVGVGKGAQSGILIKNAAALQAMSKVDTLVVDKTGTITEGQPSLLKVVVLDPTFDRNFILRHAASVNQYSEHPLGQAIVSAARKAGLELTEVDHFTAHEGLGVSGIIADQSIWIGNVRLVEEFALANTASYLAELKAYQTQGNTVSLLAIDQQVVGLLVLGDPIKEQSKAAIRDLKNKGLEIIMLTGDNRFTAASVATAVGIKKIHAELLPQDKLKIIQKLQTKGHKVAMAGDGINDAPALAQSDVGIAMGTGTDVAIESADITLVKGDLQGISKAHNLSHRVMKNIHQNLFFALIYNTLGVPVAAGVLFPIFGLLLSPMIAALAMSFSSVSVIVNALRLQAVKLE